MKDTYVGSGFDVENLRRRPMRGVRNPERLAATSDEDIDYRDIPPVGFTNAIPFRDRRLSTPVKRSTTARIDADMLHWLRAKGKGRRTRIDAMLREAMVREGRCGTLAANRTPA